MFRPKGINRLDTVAELLKPVYKKYNGERKKIYPDTGEEIFINFKTKGGTESVIDGVYVVIDTAQAVTFWRSDIKSDCRIKVGNDIYEIKGRPEDVENQHTYLVIKLEYVGGGA